MSSQFKPWMVMVTSFVTALVFMLAFTRPSLGVWSPPHTGLSLVRRANFTVSALLLATSGQNYTPLTSAEADFSPLLGASRRSRAIQSASGGPGAWCYKVYQSPAVWFRALFGHFVTLSVTKIVKFLGKIDSHQK